MTEQQNKSRVPTPPHPTERREPLPWQGPSSTQEDPQPQQRIKSILESPSYRHADADVQFLNRDDIRGLRLQMDYRKCELLMEQHSIRHTFVVLGGTQSGMIERDFDKNCIRLR